MFKPILLSLFAISCLYSDNSIVVYNNGLSLFDIKSKLGDIKKEKILYFMKIFLLI